MVQWLQSRRGSVVNCARGAFDERKNVRSELVDEGGGGIKGFCSEDGFEFGTGFAERFVDGIVHGELWVDEWSKKFESGAVTVVWMNYAELFFERVEGNSVSSAPCVN